MSSKKSLLESQLVSILSNIGQTESASKKASELAAAIDAYVDARIAGITGVTGSGTPGGPLPIPPGSLTSP
jgi:hypothetical protein